MGSFQTPANQEPLGSVPTGCPFLGLPDDPGTRYTYAAVGNFCHRVQPPQPVIAAYQGAVCLAGQEFMSCPVYKGETRRNLLPQEIVGHSPEGISGFQGVKVNWRWVAAIFVIILVVFLFLGPLRGAFSSFGAPHPVASPTGLPTASPTLSLSATPTLLAVIPSLTPTPPSTTPTEPPTLPPGTMTPGPGLLTPFGFQTQFLLHPVLEGESLLYIANLYDTTALVLRALNALDPAISIQPGDILIVAPGKVDLIDITPLQAIFLEEDVDINELASRYVTTPAKIRADNALGTGDVIPAGRWLVVPYVIVDETFTQPSPSPSPTADLSFAAAGPLGPEGAYYVHEVLPGESLPYLANLYQTTVDVLYVLNNLPDDYAIDPGDLLVVRPYLTDPAAVTQAYSAYLVEVQSSFASLAVQFSLSESDLRAANPSTADPVPANTWLLIPIQG